MRAALHILEFWALGFVSLSLTLVLLNIFWDLIGQDLCLKTLGKEAVIAGIASLVEAMGLWLIISFVPSAVQALFIPALIVAIIYKISHLEDWSHYEIVCLLFFQLVVSLIGLGLFAGHFVMAITTAIVFAVVLTIITVFMRSFPD
jgi:hypothetical protein